MTVPPASGAAALPALIGRICRRCLEVLPISAAAVTVMDDGGGWDLLHATDHRSAAVEEASFTSGQGPGPDAFRTRLAVRVPDVGAGGVLQQWPVWTRAVAGAGFRATFAWPVQAGTMAVGALTVYGPTAGDLSAGEADAGERLSEMALWGFLDAAVEPLDETGPGPGLVHSAVIYQAAGMVMVQTGLDASAALVRLRAHAFADGRPIRVVAEDVVARRLRLGRDTGGTS